MKTKYTFSKGFYDEETIEEDKLTLYESFRWNIKSFKIMLIVKSSSWLFELKWKIKIISSNIALSLMPSKSFVINLVVKLILIKLKLRGKTIYNVEKSPYSESIYIMYDYLDYNVKIRVSCHDPSRNDNSNIFVYV